MSITDLRSRRTSHSESDRPRDPSLASVFTPSTPSEEAPQRAMADSAPGAAEDQTQSQTQTQTKLDAVEPSDSHTKQAGTSLKTGSAADAKKGCKKHRDAKDDSRAKSKKRRARKHTQYSSSSSENESSSSESESSSESSETSEPEGKESESGESSSESETFQKKRRQRGKGKSGKRKAKGKKTRARKVPDFDDEDDSEDVSSEDEKAVRLLLDRLKTWRKARKAPSVDEPSENEDEDDPDAALDEPAQFSKERVGRSRRGDRRKPRGKRTDDQGKGKPKSKKKPASKVAFKRVDQCMSTPLL